MKYNKKYIKKITENPLPPLTEEERIYLNVPYAAKQFAQYSNCGFDSDKKLWFTGVHNSNLYALVDLYGVNKATSQQARQLLREKTERKSLVIALVKLMVTRNLQLLV